MSELQPASWIPICVDLRKVCMVPEYRTVHGECVRFLETLTASVNRAVAELPVAQVGKVSWQREVSAYHGLKCHNGLGCPGCSLLFSFLQNEKHQESNITVNEPGRKCILRVLNSIVQKRRLADLLQVQFRMLSHIENQERYKGYAEMRGCFSYQARNDCLKGQKEV